MGVQTSHTFPEALTPICNECGVALCWDISVEDYDERPTFWDDWCCRDCKSVGENVSKDEGHYHRGTSTGSGGVG